MWTERARKEQFAVSDTQLFLLLREVRVGVVSASSFIDIEVRYHLMCVCVCVWLVVVDAQTRRGEESGTILRYYMMVVLEA